MTLNEKYYAMNSALNTALVAHSIVCPVYKYGTVSQPDKYPYIQTTYRVTKRQPNGSVKSGTLIDFEYYLNFFTAASHERQNDAALFVPYESARELVVSPDLMIWSGITNVLNHDETPEFNFKGGLEILMKGLVFKCQSVVSPVIADTGTTVPIDEAMQVIEGSINFTEYINHGS
jgi:hypothetical protein